MSAPSAAPQDCGRYAHHVRSAASRSVPYAGLRGSRRFRRASPDKRPEVPHSRLGPFRKYDVEEVQRAREKNEGNLPPLYLPPASGGDTEGGWEARLSAFKDSAQNGKVSWSRPGDYRVSEVVAALPGWRENLPIAVALRRRRQLRFCDGRVEPRDQIARHLIAIDLVQALMA